MEYTIKSNFNQVSNHNGKHDTLIDSAGGNAVCAVVEREIVNILLVAK